jgi:hypothetical protein
MSLINDALKRAKQAQDKNPPPSASAAPPLYRPAEPRPDAGVGWFLPVMAIVLVVAAMFFIGMALFKHETKHVVIAPPPTNSVEVPVMAVPVTNLPPVSNIVATPTVTTQSPPPLPPVPPPRLQGILFDPARPSAIVSGKAVFVGDYVGDMRVFQITKSGIMLVGDGITNELFLGE